MCQYTEAEPAKFERAALRWHARFVTESSPSLLRWLDKALRGRSPQPKMALASGFLRLSPAGTPGS